MKSSDFVFFGRPLAAISSFQKILSEYHEDDVDMFKKQGFSSKYYTMKGFIEQFDLINGPIGLIYFVIVGKDQIYFHKLAVEKSVRHAL